MAGSGTTTVAPLLQATRTVPIVFVTVIDPVGAGFVATLARPGGNATGFTIYEYSMSGKLAGTAQRDRAPRDAGKALLESLAREIVARQLKGKQLVKTVVVPGRLVNFVVR